MAVTKKRITASTPARLIRRAKNKKLGSKKCHATYVSQHSCPDSCVLKYNGCYAENGSAGFTTRRLNRSRVRDPLEIALAEFGAILSVMEDFRDLRLHVVGDSTTIKGTQYISTAAGMYMRRAASWEMKDVSVWTYTHAWRDVPRAAWKDVSVLASCETTRDVRKARRRGYATAIVVPEFKLETAYVEDGVKILPCPEQTGRAKDCHSCRLCFDDKRLKKHSLTIGFAIHGHQSEAAKNRISLL